MDATPCAYCGQKAIHTDHVLPRSLVKNYTKNAARYGRPPIPLKWLQTAPSCGSCNWRKLTARLVPPSWANEVDALNEFFSGTKFRVWAGERIPEGQR